MKSTASGQALRRRRSREMYWVETAAASCCYYGGESAPPQTNGCPMPKRRATRGENTGSSASCRVGGLPSSIYLSAYKKLKLSVRTGVGYKVCEGAFVLSPLNLTQPGKFLGGPLDSAAAFTA